MPTTGGHPIELPGHVEGSLETKSDRQALLGRHEEPASAKQKALGLKGVDVKNLTLAEWENKYIAGDVQRFDQKNTMFLRPTWDPDVNQRLESWSFVGEVKDKPGYSLQDQALRWSARRGSQIMGLFNTYKPNPTSVSRAIAEAVRAATPSLPSVAYRPPKGVKLDAGDGRKITQDIKKVARWFGADLVGVCRLDRRWLYSHSYRAQAPQDRNINLAAGESLPQEVAEKMQMVVVLGFDMDYDLIKYFPTYISGAATSMGYSKMAITNNYLSAFIRNLGFETIDCTTNDVALTVPMAMQAGLGDLARNGLLIAPKFGPRIRLSKVITDLPLVPDSPIDFGVTEFCSKCEICAEQCPSQSILRGDRTTEPRSVSNIGGVRKWPIDPEGCRMYWARANRPCVTCIACCPYNKPDTRFHRGVHWFTDHVRWADPLYVRLDKLCGYGKPEKPERFWDDWEPSG